MNVDKQWRKVNQELEKRTPPEPKIVQEPIPDSPKNAPPISTQLREAFDEAAEALGNGGQFKMSKAIHELEQDKELNGS